MLVPFGGCRLEMRPDRDRIVVLLYGELDLVNIERAGAQLDELWMAGWKDVTLNLAGLTFMDVSGVRLLLELHERSDRVGLAFRVVCASAQVVRILEMTSNLHLLTHEDDRNGSRRPDSPLESFALPPGGSSAFGW